MRSAILANEMRRFDGIGLYVGMAMFVGFLISVLFFAGN